jgi:hypothetical protein
MVNLILLLLFGTATLKKAKRNNQKKYSSLYKINNPYMFPPCCVCQIREMQVGVFKAKEFFKDNLSFSKSPYSLPQS